MSGVDPADLSQIRDELLRRLYVAYFTTEDALMVREVQQQRGWDEAVFWRALDDISAEHLATQLDSGPRFEIQPAGILRVERLKLVPSELASANNRVRPLILAKYAEAYEAQGWQGEWHHREVISAVATESGQDPVLVYANHEFLFELRELQHPRSLGYFKITKLGLATVREWRRRSQLRTRFEELQNWTASPQERGRQFQKLFGQLASDAGWRVDESVLGPGEEIDLALNRDDAFYLLESRWKKEGEPVSAKEIRDFEGKLRKRSGVQGVFVSMSGYTVDATDEVERVTGDTPIILLGPGDVADLFSGALGFNDTLTEKKRSLVLHRKAPWR
jgi:hypothetical protein